ncbi:MAG: DUF4062 domain-containing protein, partial [Gemmataceae bacterium]
MASRVVRVFVSSTFRDFVEERDLLIRRVFPELRRRCRDRFVDVIGVDLRWGVTENDSQNGLTIPICLREIDRARPYFLGLLGDRYGWVPGRDDFPETAFEEHPWLADHAGRKSVTELEILHGVLNESGPPRRSAFFRRAPTAIAAEDPTVTDQGGNDDDMVAALHDRLRSGGFPITDYDRPETLAALVAERLWTWIEADYPASSTPDGVARE